MKLTDHELSLVIAALSEAKTTEERRISLQVSHDWKRADDLRDLRERFYSEAGLRIAEAFRDR